MRTMLIGSGLIGSAVARHIDADVVTGVPWNAYGPASTMLRERVAAFVADPQPWCIIWCAGISSVSSTRDDMMHETDLLDAVLTATLPNAINGRFVLTSSAGGIHGGGDYTLPITEIHQPQPVSEYGFGKYEQERMVEAWADAHGHSYAIARPSNVYGPGQNINKPQGLISQLLWRIRNGGTLEVSVPTDTTRDYIYADDAGRDIALIAHSNAIGVRLVCSGQSTSLAAVFTIARAVTGHEPNLRTVARNYGQPRHLAFKTMFPNHHPHLALGAGMWQMWASMMDAE